MPQPASAIENCPFARWLILGGPKVGKTYTVISTCPGPAYVINCDDQFALVPASRATKNFYFDHLREASTGSAASLQNKTDKCVREARDGAEAGKYKSVVVDTITLYARQWEEILMRPEADGKQADGRRTWPEYEKRLCNFLGRLFDIKAHVFVNAHYIDVGGGSLENQLEKTGQGIAPLLAGKARATVPAMFQDVLFLEKRGGKRVFVCSDEGVFGPGCRSNLDGIEVVDAHVTKLWEKMCGGPATAAKTKTEGKSK